MNKTKYEVENKKKEQILSTKRKMSPGSLKRTHNIDRSVNQQYLIGKDQLLKKTNNDKMAR